METLKLTTEKIMRFLFLGMVILLFNSCDNDYEEDLDPVESSEQLITWNELLDYIEVEAETAFIREGESLQEAVNASLPGDVIYIEPGTYQENLTINNPDLEIIGLSLVPNDLVISNSIETNIIVLKLYDQNSIDAFLGRTPKKNANNRMNNFSRTELGGGIAHYQFTMRMPGASEYNKIRVHRVVKEVSPFHPVQTIGDVFMVHGAFVGFDGTFLAAGLESNDDINATTSSPYYLATNDIDVWGIDMGWTMVPNDNTLDFSFMEGWGYEKDANHTLRAMRIARVIRGVTGQGFSGLNLLGFSSGNTVAYAAANKETQINNIWKRNIKGLISVDNAFKVLDGNSGCDAAQAIEAEIANGTHHNSFGELFQLLGYLANGEETQGLISPIFGDPITNAQAFRLVFSMDAFGMGFHFFGGDMNGLFYADETRATRLASNYKHYMPNLLWQEIDAVNCSAMTVDFDDYIHLINVPLFYIGAGGGSGGSNGGDYTASLTASTDVSSHTVTVNGDPLLDTGHVDLFLAENADQFVWSQLRGWIEGHN